MRRSVRSPAKQRQELEHTLVFSTRLLLGVRAYFSLQYSSLTRSQSILQSLVFVSYQELEHTLVSSTQLFQEAAELEHTLASLQFSTLTRSQSILQPLVLDSYQELEHTLASSTRLFQEAALGVRAYSSLQYSTLSRQLTGEDQALIWCRFISGCVSQAKDHAEGGFSCCLCLLFYSVKHMLSESKRNTCVNTNVNGSLSQETKRLIQKHKKSSKS